ncbi:hypothetical protein [Streptomyces sp. NPDC005533]|uniref:hypothetical protein n=1 Tax=Streptomyces sp. NPDC005533 TaxID=3364723 RepID=UPI0036BE2815
MRQGEEVAEQDAAVASEDDGKAAVVEDGADGVGEPDGVPGDPDGVADLGVGGPSRVVRRWLDPAGVHRAGVVRQTGREEGRGQVLDAAGAQPEHGRCLDDRRFAHGTMVRCDGASC